MRGNEGHCRLMQRRANAVGELICMSHARDDNEYYDNVRHEILPLLPVYSNKVLDIGCGNGSTLMWLKELGKCAWTSGIEIDPGAAEKARKNIDALYSANIETMDLPFEEASLDLILCLDVLEHLIDPWSATRRIQKLLRPGGALIISVPNVRCKRVLLPLLFKGKWEYADQGILDRTHLRFFVRDSAIALVEDAGLRVDLVDVTGGIARGRKAGILKAVLPNGIMSFFARQYLIRGIKPVQRDQGS